MDFKKFVYLCLFIVYSYALTLKEFNYKMICLVNKERAKKNVPYLAYSRYIDFYLLYSKIKIKIKKKKKKKKKKKFLFFFFFFLKLI